MKKSNYALFIFLCITGVSVPSVAWATVTITEVMYNPAGSDAGREWIELYNNGSESVEITSGQKGWKVSDGSNHILAQALTVPPGGFVIIATNPATFRAQYGNALFVVKSALNLTNTSGTLSLLDARREVVDTVSYTKDLGGFEDGTSLHRVGSTFAPDVPNPGVAPAPGVPKSAPPAQKTTAPTVAAAKIQPKETVVEQHARTIDKSDLSAASTLSQQGTKTKESNSLAPVQEQRSLFWHYILALTALMVFGVASVWYIRSEQTKQPETPSLADEFDIE
jgi:hypothetical protein